MKQKTKMSLLKVTINNDFTDLLLNELSKIQTVHIKSKTKSDQEKKEKDQVFESIKQLRKNLDDLFKKLKLNVSEFQQLRVKKKDKFQIVIKDLKELINYISEEITFSLNRVNELDRFIANAKIELENRNLIKICYTILGTLNITRDKLDYFNQLKLKAYTTFNKNLENLKTLFEFSSIPNFHYVQDISQDRIFFYIIYPKNKENNLLERINLIHAEEVPILKKYLTNDGVNLNRINGEIVIIENTLMKYEKEKQRIKDDNLLRFAAINEIIQNIEEYNWAEHQLEEISSEQSTVRFFVPINRKDEIKKDLMSKFKEKIMVESLDIPKDQPISERKSTKFKLEELDSKEKFYLKNQRETEKSKEDKKEDLRNETPTMMRNFFLFRPYELLTKMYGTPSYSEIDPTPFLFFTFPLLFGLMFGDIGHGLCLIIAGFLGGIIFGKRKKNFRNFSWIIFYCGWGAIFGGLLYGEFFGSNQFFNITLARYTIPFLNISLNDPLANVIVVFKAAIIIGVIHINLGWFIQFVNYWKQKQKYLAFSDSLTKIALLTGGTILIFMWGFDIYAWIEPPYPILLTLIPGIILILSKPLGKTLGVSYLRGESYSSLMGEGSIEAFETFLSVLSNAASYIRLLALALAHIALLISIQAMVDLIQGEGVIIEVLRIVGLIFGNIVVILIEGLLVFLNAIRLHFYEFFFKFYRGSGTEYTPFTQENNFSNIIFKGRTEKDLIKEEIEKEIEREKIKEDVKQAINYISDKYL